MNYLKNIYTKKHSFFILLFLSLTGISLGQSTQKTKVFLLAGQSNMDGRGDASKLSEAEMKLLANASQKIHFIYKGTVGEGNAIQYKGALDFTNPWSFVKQKFRIEKCFGPELFFGVELVKNYPKQDYLFIKRSQGGTSLYGAWNPNWSFEKASFFNEQNKPKLYQDFIDLVDAELAELHPDSYEIVGMLWVQGETDSNTSNGSVAANTYHLNLENLINSVRGHYDIPDLPFLILGVGSKKVQKAMVQVSNKLTNVSYIERSQDVNRSNYTPIYTHKWNGKPVGHYNYEGMKKMGRLFFESYQTSYANNLQ
ncbi:MAG: sialate O-acetylesterase [Flavobacteriaceae bacterium]|nr:sialate O-acetylesterase [Flavobacteriaceae bacterium]